jgi:hypothetical protein
VSKTLRFDSAEFPEMVGKTEGMALLGDRSLALIDDDDFGITGGRQGHRHRAALSARITITSVSPDRAMCDPGAHRLASLFCA